MGRFPHDPYANVAEFPEYTVTIDPDTQTGTYIDASGNDFPGNLTMVAEVGGGRGLSGRLITTTRTADLANVRSLYYRRPSAFSFPGLSTQDARFAAVQARYGLGGVLTSLPGCLYVNHPHAIADAEFKPAQLSAAVALGFDVPPTLITNDPREGTRLHKWS